MNERRLEKDAIPVIYSMKATGEINHYVATKLRTAFEQKKLRLLMNDIEAREDMIESKSFLKKSADEQYRLLKPFVTSTALQNELINLVYEVRNGFIKIKEVGTTTKDRYSSIGYCNYYANILEEELTKDKNTDDILAYCMF